MCHQKILHHSEKALVSYCKGCEHYQLAYYTTFVRMTEIEFEQFYVDIEMFSNKGCHDCTIKNKWIPLPNHNSMLVISGKELYQLKIVIEECKATLELDKLLSNLKISLN